MNRWNIRTLAFYSHDGRRRDVTLTPNAVNILTGPSHTGKSAIVEALDYCLGASDCHLPGVVRDAVSWVGIVWERGADSFAVARPVPIGAATTVNEMYWRRGATTGEPLLPASAGGLRALGSRDIVMRHIEAAFGIGEVLSETLSAERTGVSVSARHAVPYILQDDDVIISKMTLLRGANDERRQHIIETLPYFLGVSDEKAAAAEAEYRALTKRLRAEERRLAELQRLVSTEQDRSFGLVTEAAHLGLCELPPGPIALPDALDILGRVSQWSPGASPLDENSQLGHLYAGEAETRARIASLRERIRTAERSLGALSRYDGAVQEQHARLAHVNIFRMTDDVVACPVCDSEVGDVPALATLRTAQKALSRELDEVGRDRPKIDTFLRETREDLDSAIQTLSLIRGEISALVKESDTSAERLSIDHRRSRVLGRVSLYVESRAALQHPVISTDTIDSLRRRREELEALIDKEGLRERLDVAQQKVGTVATAVLAELPFEDAYRGADVYFNARHLSCGASTVDRNIPMRDIGSDENYLSLHVAVLTALHRFFHARRAPVPGVLLFDQLSRPYYPPEKRPEEVIIDDDTENTALKQYFDFLFRETARGEGLQVIVLEHAYFAGNERFLGAVKERWSRTGEKLIPADWPRRSS